jgi:hypothetical protein
VERRRRERGMRSGVEETKRIKRKCKNQNKTEKKDGRSVKWEA